MSGDVVYLDEAERGVENVSIYAAIATQMLSAPWFEGKISLTEWLFVIGGVISAPTTSLTSLRIDVGRLSGYLAWATTHFLGDNKETSTYSKRVFNNWNLRQGSRRYGKSLLSTNSPLDVSIAAGDDADRCDDFATADTYRVFLEVENRGLRSDDVDAYE